MLSRYAQKIDNLVEILLAETANEGSGTPLGPIASESPVCPEGPEGPEGRKIPGDPENQEGPAEMEVDQQETLGNENSKTPAAEETREKDIPVDKYMTVFKKTDLKDQLFTIQMIRKFSASELRDIYQLYSGGKKSRGELLTKLKAKISPEELQHIKEVFQRNKDLL